MNRMRGTLLVSALLAGLIPLFLMPQPLKAQEKVPDKDEVVKAITTATVEDVGQQGAKILGRLDLTIQQFRRYDERLTSASAEDSMVLRLQIAQTRDKFMDSLNDLGEVLSRAREDGSQQELLTRGETVYVAVTPRIWDLIGEVRREIDGHRSLRPGTPPGDRSALEDDLALLTDRLDRYFAYGWTHIQKMESFGLETTEARETLTGLLEERADELSGRLDLASLRGRELSSRLKDQPGDADLTILGIATRNNLRRNTESQTVILDIMDAMDLSTDRYRAQLVTLTQDLAAGLMDAKVAARLFSRGWDAVKSWLTNTGPAFLVKMLLFAIIVVVGWFFARLVSKAVKKSLDRGNLNMSFLLKRMIVTFSKNAIILLALVFGLAQLGFSLGPLLAGFGVIGFILGFAMQDSLSNLAAGMMILINRPYDVGDLVEISGAFGKVEQMSMVSTTILTLDNQKLVVPNNKIWGDVIKNVTDQKIRRVDMTFGISYTDDIPQAEQVLIEILNNHDKVLDDPEPMVRLHTLNDSSVDFIVRPWVRTDDYWDIYWDVTRAVKMRFDAEGISIPFPQRDVHIYEQKKLSEVHSPESEVPVAQDPVDKTGQDEPGSD